ncbi:MAG: hypothetical protein LIP77_03765 [Planctomycetes bacterium]|nr:hypothetical protein [Planctomycetota bacterium]
MAIAASGVYNGLMATGSGFPAAGGGKVFGSIAEVTSSLFALEDQWREKYTADLAGAEGDGRMTVGDLTAYLNQEFAHCGVTFVDYNPSAVKAGQHLVYIDDTHRQRMADDPEYRAKTMALMQREFAGIQGCTIRDARGTVNHTLTGTVFSLCEENEEVGGSKYRGMAQGAARTVGGAGGTDNATNTRGGSKKKSLLQLLAERQAEMREKTAARKEEQRIQAEQPAARQPSPVPADPADTVTDPTQPGEERAVPPFSESDALVPTPPDIPVGNSLDLLV